MAEKQENRAFNEMLIAGKKRLENKSPIEIAKNSGAIFDEETSTIKLQSFDRLIEIKYPSYDVSGWDDEWYILMLLHYLDLADGTPMEGKWIHFGELKDGLIRGSRYDKTIEEEMAKFLAKKDEDKVINACKALGGEVIKSKADFSAVFKLYPNYPIAVNIWFEDEEFPAEAKMLIDKSADNYLTIEDAVVAAELMMRSIFNKYDELYK